MAWIGAGTVVGVVLAASGCSAKSSASPHGEDVGSTAQAIQGGTTDTTSKFAVGVCDGNAGSCVGICSGALILPNVVATARHCVDETPDQIDCTTNPTFGSRKQHGFSITTNTTMSPAANGWYGVKSIAVPSDDHICGNDIALLVLNSSIPSSVTKPITPGVQYVMWDPAADYAVSFSAIGYGNTSPAGGGSGTRRAAHYVSILCIPGSENQPCPTEFNEKEFVGGDATCSGDSGSSAYETVSREKGSPVSFGVLSRGGQSQDGTKCQGSVYTRFDAHRDFVLKVAKAASNDWALYPEPSWTEPKPPPVPTKPPTTTKKDAGAAVDSAAPPSKPTGLGIGESCESVADCTSGVCSDQGDGTRVCTEACDETSESSCPSGYECRESLCLPAVAGPPAPAAATVTKTTTGCASVRSSAGGSWTWAALGTATALVAARRRRRAAAPRPS
ncbi:MAG TPA: trypsin-like serine protease [Labilithrix sp.]|nr:trypsin-like serine protease [Labilithrix sp.]